MIQYVAKGVKYPYFITHFEHFPFHNISGHLETGCLLSLSAAQKGEVKRSQRMTENQGK